MGAISAAHGLFGLPNRFMKGWFTRKNPVDMCKSGSFPHSLRQKKSQAPDFWGLILTRLRPSSKAKAQVLYGKEIVSGKSGLGCFFLQKLTKIWAVHIS